MVYDNFAEYDHQDYQEETEDVNKTPQRLRNALRKAHAEIVQLEAKIKDKESVNNSDNEGKDIIHQRNVLLTIMSHHEAMIERMSSDISLLESQLKVALSAKFDALARLDAVEGNVFAHLFEEKIMDMAEERPKRNLQLNDEILRQQLDAATQKLREQDDAMHRNSGETSERRRSRKNRNEIPILSSTNATDTTDVEMAPESSNSNEQEETIEISDCEFDNVSSTCHRKNKSESSPNSPGLQLDLQLQVRTRRQTQFLLDVLRG